MEWIFWVIAIGFLIQVVVTTLNKVAPDRQKKTRVKKITRKERPVPVDEFAGSDEYVDEEEL